MGTYTTNYNLFLPTIGEQGWGDLVNGNFTTIDATIKGLDMRVGTLETETTAIDERVTVLEAGKFDNIEANNIVGNVDVTNSLLYVPYPEVPSLARILWQNVQYKDGMSSAHSISVTNSKFVPTTGILCKTLTIEGYSYDSAVFNSTLYGTKNGVETVLKTVNGATRVSYNCSIEDYLSYSSFRYYVVHSGGGHLIGNCNFVICVKSFIM